MICILLLNILVCSILQISSGQYYYDKPGIKFQTEEKFGPTSEHVGYDYPKPNIPFEYWKSTVESTTSLYDITKGFVTQTANPGIKSGYQYSKPQSPLLYPQKEIYKGEEGYVYPKPPNPLVIPELTTSSLSTEKPVHLSTTPRPTNPTYKNGEGYIYSKQDNSLILSTPTPLSILKTVKPTNLISKKNKGYIYEIPINPLVQTLASSSPITKEPFVVSTTMKTTFPMHNNEEGYNYPKPENPLIITRPTYAPIKISTTTEKQHISTITPNTNPSLLLKGEHLSKPTQGYEYPKPSIPFNSNPLIPTKSPNKSNGYNYPKPDVSFEPEPINEIPRETISGYKYPKPSIPFEI